jgi:hypothetical protein
MDLSKEINTQDNRATAKPYYFSVMETVEEATGEGMGEEVWVCDGSIALRTKEDIKEAVYEWKDWDLENKDHQEKFNKLNSFEIDEILEKNYRKVSITQKERHSNCFLTFKAYKQHVKVNGHNLKNPQSFLNHAYRNEEMERLFDFLTGLTEEPNIGGK